MPAAKKPGSRNIKVSKQAVDEAFKALSNWGRWGKDDEIGTLNHITPADVVAAGKLIKRGKVFALGMPLGQSGPQRGLFGKRWNPIHTMLATGTDAQEVEIRKADFVIVRTGQMEACNKRKEWGGYAGGDAPGLKFESCYWLQEKEVAGVCSDTWGVEVRPNETKDVNQPWHWVVIPAMGLYMGEMFDLKELAEDCAKDKVYEFFFCGAPLVIPGGTGSPINPQA